MRRTSAAQQGAYARGLSLGIVAIVTLMAGGCAVHPAPDVALDMQHEVSPAPEIAPHDQSLVTAPAATAKAAPGVPQAHPISVLC